MHKLNIVALYPDEGWQLPKLRPYFSDVCRTAESIFDANISVLEGVGMVPGYAFMNGENWGVALELAMNEMETDNRDSPAVHTRASKIWDENDLAGFDESSRKHFKEATGNAEKMACLPGRRVSHGALHSLLITMINGAWTAIEVLAGSLVRETVAGHRVCFSHLTGTEKFEFQKREPMRDAFKLAFAGDTKIQNAIGKQEIDAVSLARNLFVHKGGIVDGIFKRQCGERGLTGWADLPEKSKLEMSGDKVFPLVCGAIKCGFTLIAAVDDWIKLNTPRP